MDETIKATREFAEIEQLGRMYQECMLHSQEAGDEEARKRITQAEVLLKGKCLDLLVDIVSDGGLNAENQKRAKKMLVDIARLEIKPR